MKLAVPVLGIIVAAGGCCCCGDFTDELSEYGGPSGDYQIDVPAEATTPDAAAPSAPSGGGSSVASVSGACGRFETMGIGAPSGFSVLACSDTDGQGGLVLKGSGSPKDACGAMKDWITGAGWTVTFSSDMGTSSIMSEKGSEQLIVACNEAAGSTNIAVSLSNK